MLKADPAHGDDVVKATLNLWPPIVNKIGTEPGYCSIRAEAYG